MSRSVRLSEYYDLFDIKADYTDSSEKVELKHNDDLNDKIQDMNITNPFIGFSNWSDFKTNNQTETPHGSGTYKANNIITVTGKHFSPQALNTVSINENGDILCYPPNAPVPYWSKIIFRNFDYQFNPPADAEITNKNIKKYAKLIQAYADKYGADYDTTTTKIFDFDNAPLFLRFPDYCSRSHVVFSSCDKTRNPDIEHIFGYNHGATEPILLNLSMSASNFITDIDDRNIKYNENLNKDCIETLLIKCYWCIEWVYEAKDTNTD